MAEPQFVIPCPVRPCHEKKGADELGMCRKHLALEFDKCEKCQLTSGSTKERDSGKTLCKKCNRLVNRLEVENETNDPFPLCPVKKCEKEPMEGKDLCLKHCVWGQCDFCKTYHEFSVRALDFMDANACRNCVNKIRRISNLPDDQVPEQMRRIESETIGEALEMKERYSGNDPDDSASEEDPDDSSREEKSNSSDEDEGDDDEHKGGGRVPEPDQEPESEDQDGEDHKHNGSYEGRDGKEEKEVPRRSSRLSGTQIEYLELSDSEKESDNEEDEVDEREDTSPWSSKGKKRKGDTLEEPPKKKQFRSKLINPDD